MSESEMLAQFQPMQGEEVTREFKLTFETIRALRFKSGGSYSVTGEMSIKLVTTKKALNCYVEYDDAQFSTPGDQTNDGE